MRILLVASLFLLTLSACVSSPIDDGGAAVARVYDVRRLLVGAPNFTIAPEFDLHAALSCSSSGGPDVPLLQASALFDEPDAATEADAMALRGRLVDALIELIQDSIGKQDEWAAYGGEMSSIRELNGNLIIKTSPANHRGIETLLGGLGPGRGSDQSDTFRTKTP